MYTDEQHESHTKTSLMLLIKKWGIERIHLHTLPSNQYHQMATQASEELGITYKKVIELLDQSRCSNCGAGQEDGHWSGGRYLKAIYCDQCGHKR